MVYLIWERQSYCDYDVVYITHDKSKAEKLLTKLHSEYGVRRYSLEEKELEKFYEIEW